MSAIEDAKRALKACEDGIALITAQQKSNEVLVKDFNDRSRGVTAKRDAYQAAKSERERQQQDWDSRRDQIKNKLLDEKEERGCAVRTNKPPCRDGWHGVDSRSC